MVKVQCSGTSGCGYEGKLSEFYAADPKAPLCCPNCHNGGSGFRSYRNHHFEVKNEESDEEQFITNQFKHTLTQPTNEEKDVENNLLPKEKTALKRVLNNLPVLEKTSEKRWLENQKERNYKILKKLPDLQPGRHISIDWLRRNFAIFRLYRYCNESIDIIASKINRNPHFVQKIIGQVFEVISQESYSEIEESIYTESNSLAQEEKILRRNKSGNKTWCDAAYNVLKIVNRPLTIKELTSKILSQRIIESRSNAPWTILYLRIYDEIKNEGAESRFVRIGGSVALREWNNSLKEKDDNVDDNQGQETQEIPPTSIIIDPSSQRDIELSSSLQREIQQIREFLASETLLTLGQEKLCFWVWFCYQFTLYNEGLLIFEKIDPTTTPPLLYQMVRRFALMCDNRMQAFEH